MSLSLPYKWVQSDLMFRGPEDSKRNLLNLVSFKPGEYSRLLTRDSTFFASLITFIQGIEKGFRVCKSGKTDKQNGRRLTALDHSFYFSIPKDSATFLRARQILQVRCLEVKDKRKT
jgi:hypothetical protein